MEERVAKRTKTVDRALRGLETLQTITTETQLIHGLYKRDLAEKGERKERVNVHRDFKKFWLLTRRDFFSEDATIHLRSVFRVSYEVFNVLFTRLPEVSPFWTLQNTGFGTKGIYPGQKILVALKILASGSSASSVMREFGMGITTIHKCLDRFAVDVLTLFEEEYLTEHLTDPVKLQLSMANSFRKHRLPGYAGSIDCVHVSWHRCPHADQGVYKSRYKEPTLVSEAICDSNLFFLHLYSGSPGTVNDLSILRLGTFTRKLFNNALPECPYQIANEDFTRPYFFADGIYPRWPVLMTAPQAPSTPAEKKFTRKQESVRKDIERAFGVLKARFRILKNGFWYQEKWKCVALTRVCFVLHNMIIFHNKDKDPVEDLLELNIIASEDEVNADAGLTLVEEPKQMVVEENEEEKEERETQEKQKTWYFSRTEHNRLREAFYRKYM